MKKYLFNSLALLCALSSANLFAAMDRKPNSRSPIRQSKIFGSSTVDKSKNPLIGASALFLGKVGKPISGIHTGPEIQDVNVGIAGNIDQNFSGKIYLDSFQVNGVVPGLDMVREAYGKTMTIPVIAFKFGKFLADFGENNLTYLHSQPMVDRPLIITETLGATGLSSVGAQMDFEIPTPWKFDLSFAILSGRLSGTAFNAPNDESLIGTARMRHEFELTETTNLSFGGSVAYGNNATLTKNTIVGADLVLKYSATKDNSGFGFAWYNEFINDSRSNINDITGFYTNPMFRFHPKFWAGLRFDYVSRGQLNDKSTDELFMLAYVPSETTALRLQGGPGQNDSQGNTWLLQLQYNITLGDLPGHAL